MTHERLERRLDEREERQHRERHEGEQQHREVRSRRAGFASWRDEERHLRGEVPVAYWDR